MLVIYVGLGSYNRRKALCKSTHLAIIWFQRERESILPLSTTPSSFKNLDKHVSEHTIQQRYHTNSSPWSSDESMKPTYFTVFL